MTTAAAPLVDRELFFGNPEILSAQLSPDGALLAFRRPWNGVVNIWAKKVDAPFESAWPLTAERARPIPNYLWSRSSRCLIYLRDNDGDENFNVYAVDPMGTPPDGQQVPAARDLTGLTGVRVVLYSIPKSDPDTVYIGLNDRDRAWHDLYKLRLSDGERTLVRRNTQQITHWIFDTDGTLRLAYRVARSGEQQFLRVDGDRFTEIYSCGVLESCWPLRFHRDGRHLYVKTNKGADVDLTELRLLDTETGDCERVESDPLARVDFGAAWFSEVTGELTWTTYMDDTRRRYFRDAQAQQDVAWLDSQLPARDVTISSRTIDDTLWLLSVEADTEPGETYVCHWPTRTLTFQFKIRERLPRDALVPMKPVRYVSTGGLEIPAYLLVPHGAVDGERLPAVVLPHGGPWERETWGYHGLAQFFANRGYAVLLPNFRGSTGYGKHYLNAGNGEWARGMQDDISCGVRWLVASGIADPERVGIVGWSYGGYAALAGVAFTPGLYRAAVSVVGLSNLVTFMKTIPPYWQALRHQMCVRMADPDTPEGHAWLVERSPLSAVDRIRTPLMIVHGANDPRVNKAESEQIVAALHQRRCPVEYLLLRDEGHYFSRPLNNLAVMLAIEQFLAGHLHGRYQDTGGEPERRRLEELRVDPSTVVPAVTT